MSAAAVAPRLALWLAACMAVPACFSDGGQPPAATGPATTTTTGTTEPATSGLPTTTATATSTGPATTTEATAPVCGDGVLEGDEACDDGNLDDADACLSDCQVATCGDGVVLPGVEECDAGDANHPSDPDAACRTSCKLPACGDGALYLGPLGPEIVVTSVGGAPVHSNDSARAIGVDGLGEFTLLYGVEGNFQSRIYVFKLDPGGLTIDPAASFTGSQDARRDPVIAVAPGGDFALAWESDNNSGDIFVLGVIADVAGNDFNAITTKAGIQESPSVALDDLGRLVLAFTGEVQPATHVFVRLIDAFDPASPAEQQISEHLTGAATSPTVALAPSGAFVVAWGDPGGAIVYRRFSPEGVPGPTIKSSLVTGGLANQTTSRPWSGAAIRPTDASVVIAGLGPDGLVNLERFDPADVAQERVAVSAAPRLLTPFLDLASDPWGNLAVVWAECGLPDDVGGHCGELPHDLQFAAVRADMSLHAAPTLVHSGAGEPPPPVGLVFAPTGAAALTFTRGNDTVVRIAPLTCP